jgi:hypothetical protein
MTEKSRRSQIGCGSINFGASHDRRALPRRRICRGNAAMSAKVTAGIARGKANP